ncbi:MAG: sigma-54-dependent Fis family transcriptional regulator [Rhizobiales bacterium]|nr:sigma-54-dependent Fis family transcriptional regulator [Hyphomicrobiales bacterium]
MSATQTNGSVILIEDDDDLRPAITQGLELEGFDVKSFRSAGDALKEIRADFAGVVVSDIKMPDVDGLELMSLALEIDSALPVILITGHGDVPLAVKAIQSGAYEFLEKPFSPTRLGEIVSRGIEKRRLVLENRALRKDLPNSEALADVLVGSSAVTQRLRSEVLAIAQTDADVLLQGDTGVGKELISRAIHNNGARKGKPFVALNCGALPENLIESELFGHVKGAFTGAHENRIGKIQHADGGTILLDEVESMPVELQIKLLRVLEERTIEQLGSNKLRKVDVRFIAASKSDLSKESQVGNFRADLFYRLNVVNILIPSLDDRKEDIPDLFMHLARLARARYRKEIPEMEPSMIAELQSHEWPGNIRELRNIADRFVLGLWRGFDDYGTQTTKNASSDKLLLKENMDNHERLLIVAELKKNAGKLKPTYEALGISRKALYDKMKRFGLDG